MFEYLVELTGLPSDPESDWTLAELLEWRPLSEAAAWAPVGEVLDAAERLMPDEELVAVLKHLRTRSLEPADHVRILRLWERHVSWSAAQQQHWLAAIGGAAAEPEEWADEEVGASLRLSAAAGGKRLYVARMLARRFSIAHASLETGDITWLHALALAEETRHIDDDAARRVERIVMPHAHRQTVGVFRHAVKRAVLAADSEGAAQRHARARAGRSVRFTPLPDGMALIEATMPAPEAMTVWQGLDLLDRRGKLDTPGDVRGRDARLSDVLFGVFAGILSDPDMPRTHGRPFAVGATADLATLLGLADNPGHLDGYGAIPAGMVRELAANAEWKLLVTDALSGQVSSVGTLRYRPGPRLAEFLTARDRTCRFPNCRQPGYRCDVDHRKPYDHDNPSAGGQTDEDNCWLLCERHHRLKHETCWRVDVINGNVCEWTSPAGQRYTVDAEDLRPLDLRALEWPGAAPPAGAPPDGPPGGACDYEAFPRRLRVASPGDRNPAVDLDPPF